MGKQKRLTRLALWHHRSRQTMPDFSLRALSQHCAAEKTAPNSECQVMGQDSATLAGGLGQDAFLALVKRLVIKSNQFGARRQKEDPGASKEFNSWPPAAFYISWTLRLSPWPERFDIAVPCGTQLLLPQGPRLRLASELGRERSQILTGEALPCPFSGPGG